jgi:hypothetical protein
MNAGRVDGVNRAHAGQQRRDERPGQLVHELAEDAVFLGRAADHGEGPDRVAAVVDAADVQHREIVLEAVVAEVVAEGPFGLELAGMDFAQDAEIRVGTDGQRPAFAAREVHAPSAQAPAKASSGMPSGKGIMAAMVRAGGPPT